MDPAGSTRIVVGVVSNVARPNEGNNILDTRPNKTLEARGRRDKIPFVIPLSPGSHPKLRRAGQVSSRRLSEVHQPGSLWS